MLLIESRRTSRVAGGELVPLDQQDRGGWDRALIDEGHDLVRECLARRAPRAVPDPRGHQRRPHRRPHRRRHRLGADRHALRAAAGRRPVPVRRAQPCRRDRRARRPRARADHRRPARPVDVPRLARHPRRPAPPDGPQRGVAGGVRRGDRGHRQRGRAGLPGPAARPAVRLRISRDVVGNGLLGWRHDTSRTAAAAHRRRGPRLGRGPDGGRAGPGPRGRGGAQGGWVVGRSRRSTCCAGGTRSPWR